MSQDTVQGIVCRGAPFKQDSTYVIEKLLPKVVFIHLRLSSVRHPIEVLALEALLTGGALRDPLGVGTLARRCTLSVVEIRSEGIALSPSQGVGLG